MLYIPLLLVHIFVLFVVVYSFSQLAVVVGNF